MSLLADYSHVATIEILSVLKRMSERCGPSFQVTSKTLNKIIEERFGITYQGPGRKLLRHVVDVLISCGVLEVWDTKIKTKSSLVIYQVNTFALMNNDTRGVLVSRT